MSSIASKTLNDILYSPIGGNLELMANAVTTASKTPVLADKRACFEAAFQQVRLVAQYDGALPPELVIPFHQFLEAFAKSTCYAQQGANDPEEGFKKSAKLMELSFLLQLKERNLIEFNYNWGQHETLESLIQSCDFFKEVEVLNVTPEVATALQQKDCLFKTMKLMTYSHQNITSLKKDNYPFHQKYNDFAEALLDKESVQGKLEFADYSYNRNDFLISQQNLPEKEAYEKKIAAYHTLLGLYNDVCGDSPDLELKRIMKSKIAQINNKKGLITQDTHVAEEYFRVAFSQRKALLEDALGTPEQHETDEFLLANIRTGLIDCLCQPPLEQSRLKEAKEHSDALKEYMERNSMNGNVHAYAECYESAVKKVEDALNF